MSTSTPPDGTTGTHPQTTMTPAAALQWAWGIWISLPILPWLLSIYVLWRASTAAEAENEPMARNAFLATLIYAAVIVPAALFWRARLFRDYSSGNTVLPRTYLLGMSALWLALATVGFLASLGCLLSGKLMPNLIIGVVALLAYWTFWPTGDAMVRRVGGVEDPEIYEEPR